MGGPPFIRPPNKIQNNYTPHTLETFFFIVLFTAPAPSNVQSILATKCLDHSQNKSQFFYVRPAGGCDKIDELHGPEAEAKHLTDRNVVFVFQVKLDFYLTFCMKNINELCLFAVAGS